MKDSILEHLTVMQETTFAWSLCGQEVTQE